MRLDVLRARSMAEARLFMNLQPCVACGHRGHDAPSELVERGDDLAAISRGPCARCASLRSFEILLPEPPVGLAYGGAAASTLIDAGEWLALADARSATAPPTAAGLRDAIAAIDEVLKFMSGVDHPPPAAFFSTRGREVYRAEPGRFDRQRLEAVREAWRELVGELAGE